MAKESRFAEIYRQEIKKGKGIMGAFASTGGARAKEALDLRQYLLPQTGVTGAIAERMFGKSFKYGRGTPVRNVGGGTTNLSERDVSNKITRIDINSRITARNTSILPAMAKEMNLTRLNMQKLVVLAGGKASKTSTLKNTSLIPSTKETPKEKDDSGGLFGGIGGLLGGALSGIGSIFSGVASFFGNVGGGLLKGISSLFSGMGFWGVILLAGVGFLVSELFRNVDFGSLGESFGGIGKALKDLFTGEGSEKKGLIQATKDNWSGLVDAVDKTKNEFLNMWEAVKAQVRNIGMLFDGIGGGWGLLGMLLGAGVVAKFAAPLLLNPVGALVALLVGLVGKAAYDLLNLPKDDRPLTNKEKADSEQNAMAGGFKDQRVRAGERRKLEQLDKEIEYSDPIAAQKIQDEINQIQNAPLGNTKLGKQRISKKQAELEALQKKKVDVEQVKQNDRELSRTGAVSGTSPTKLEGFNYESYAAAIGQRESSGNYKAVNNLGYVGKYQMGSAALQDAGLVKAKTKQSVDEISNPNNWILPGGLQAFLNNPELQEKVMLDYTKRNMNALKSLKVIDDKSSGEDLAGALATAHLLGPGGAQQLINQGNDGKDAYGTKGSDYLALGKASQSGQPTLAAVPKSAPPGPSPKQEEEMSLMGAMLASIGAIMENGVNGIAAAVSQGNQEQKETPIESPYDMDMFKEIVKFHGGLGTDMA